MKNAMTITCAIALASCGEPRAAEKSVAPTSGASGAVITLGTRGGPLPTADRAQSANLLVVDDALFLIDAGDGVTRRIVESGHDFRKVDKVFLTHLHSDHANGLATLLGTAWEFQRREPIDVYGSGVDRFVNGALEYLMSNVEIRAALRKSPMTDIVRAHDIEPGTIYQDAKVKVTAVENTHFNFRPDSPAYGRHRSYSYRFELANRVVVFTGDTGPSDAVTELARGADLLVAEVGDPDGMIALYKQNGAWQKKTPAEQAALRRQLTEEHIMPETIGRMATRAGVKTVVLTHLVPTADPDDTYQRYIDEAKQFYSGPIYIAQDLRRY